MDEQFNHSMSDPPEFAHRQGMNKPLSECSYTDQVARYLEGWGHLAAASVVSAHAEYVAKAQDWGMTAIQCAKNLHNKHMGGA